MSDSGDPAGSPQPIRTPPLWGVSRTAPYLHDCRAITLEEAIDAHRGEADRARDEFDHLRMEDRKRVLGFLRSL